ncbi:ADP-glucose pyrophosphorylase large family protein [Salix suchowensis]|nr:ADP-glucose pyrophosphorylase large family protein [Salix suchowensis]
MISLRNCKSSYLDRCVLAASQTTREAERKWFKGTTNAVTQFTWVFEDAKNRNIENILILYGDHLYRMNYMDFVKVCHYSSNDINFDYI